MRCLEVRQWFITHEAAGDHTPVSSVFQRHTARTVQPIAAHLSPQRYNTLPWVSANLEASVAEIAASLGFTDQSHFTVVFRKLIGITHGIWRRERQPNGKVQARSGPSHPTTEFTRVGLESAMSGLRRRPRGCAIRGWGAERPDGPAWNPHARVLAGRAYAPPVPTLLP